MPSINDIMQVAEALEKSPVAVLQDRCVAVRNRNATCRKCVEVCPYGAIDVYANEIQFDVGDCIACGACTTVCPTEALVSVRPVDADLVRTAEAAVDAYNAATTSAGATAESTVCIFACARIASKKLADPALFAEAPCLARIEESLILSLVAKGVTEILLVDGNCSTCKYQDCVEAIDDTVDSANGLIAAQGSKARVMRSSAFPESALVESVEGKFGSTRRGFFSDAASAARETALAAAKTTIAQEFGIKDVKEAIGKRLRVDENGEMPRLQLTRHNALIDAMDAIGSSVVDVIESRRFGNVDINVAKCNACGMCAVFCPSGALRRDGLGSGATALKRIEFSASDCVQCGLCEDVCWKGALTVSPSVPVAQLFDFEPVTFDLTKATPSARKPFGH